MGGTLYLDSLLVGRYCIAICEVQFEIISQLLGRLRERPCRTYLIFRIFVVRLLLLNLDASVFMITSLDDDVDLSAVVEIGWSALIHEVVHLGERVSIHFKIIWACNYPIGLCVDLISCVRSEPAARWSYTTR